eukprot:TRINITY_DN10183_c0_g2_i1.p1 TRINITY_DN10183_c0_g2~~TRINITY_DN10183_c0_g2_i1.p1  ORF type:complete len:746 (-),score=237.13 TRINITY_DN10183_c0_g2_i1:48-2285(-)
MPPSAGNGADEKDDASASSSSLPGASVKPIKLSGWLKSKAASLEGHVKEIRENTKLIAQDVADGALKGIWAKPREERFDVTFVDRALGLELDLQKAATVRSVKPGGQAERLTVCAQDRLVAIAGQPLPEPDNPDFVEAVKGRMSNLPRPVTLTFARVIPEDAPGGGDPQLRDALQMLRTKASNTGSSAGGAASGGGQAANGAGASASSAGASGHGREGPGLAELQAELAACRTAVQRYECDAALAREDAARETQNCARAEEEIVKLRGDLADLSLKQAWVSDSRSQDEDQELQAEALAAKAEASEALAELRRTSAALEAQGLELGQAQAAADAEAAAAKRQASTSEATARTVQELRDRLAKATKVEIDCEQSLKESVDSLESRCAEAERARTSNADALARLEVQEAEAAARSLEATSELEELQLEQRKRTIATSASERLTQELRREVERLRGDVRRAEASTAPAEVARAQALEEENNALNERLRSEEALGARLRSEAAAATAAAASAAAAPAARSTSPSPPSAAVLGRTAASAGLLDETDYFLVDAEAGLQKMSEARPSETSAADEQQRRRMAALEERIAELEAQNADYKRQVDSRPIVYQFAPLPDDVENEEEEEDEAPEAENDVEASANARGVTGASGSAGGSDGGARRPMAGIARQRRAISKAVLQCRRMGPVKSVERSFRTFTIKLLRRPLLMWLFYVHVAALWTLEAFRQARSQAASGDPASRLDHQLVVESNRIKPSPR